MKKPILSLLAAAILTPAALVAATFEGRISMKLTAGKGAAQEMSYLVKGDKLRLEMPARQGMTASAILEPAQKKATVIMDEQKMAMVMTLPDATPAPGEKPADAPTIEKTGETEKLFGQTAEKYIITDRGTKTDVWLAEGLGQFVMFNPSGAMMGGRGGAPAPQSWERALAGKELFPLRVVSYDKSGKEASRMEVTAIEKKSLADSLFVVPPDYQTMDMSAMMKGAMPGGIPGTRR